VSAAQAPLSLDAQHPWPGLLAFTEASSGFFFGRGADQEALLSRVVRETATLLFGQSGLGKTSLLQAGLVPALRSQGYAPVLVRLDHDREAGALFAQVAGLMQRSFEAEEVRAPPFALGETVWEYLHRRDLALRDREGQDVAPAIIFDQFEEIFTLGLGRPETRFESQRFLQELADLIENRRPAAFKARVDAEPAIIEQYLFNRVNYRIVLSLREDYLPHLEGVRARAPSLGANRLRLTRLDGGSALQAVLRPGAALVREAVARSIVEFVGSRRAEDPFGPEGEARSLESSEVEPSLLSLFCQHLNEERIEARLPEITSELLSQKRHEILESFYERAFADLPEALREFVEEQLVTDSGHRESMSLERARRALAAAGVATAALDELVQRRIVHVEERLEVPRVELIHDLLIPIVQKSREARRERAAIVAERLRAEEAARQDRASLEAKSRSRLRAVLYALAIALVLGILSGVFFVQSEQAQRRNVYLADIISGYSYQSAGFSAQAIKKFDDARALMLDRGEAFVGYGDVATARRDFAQAIKYYSEAIEKDSSLAAAFRHRATAHEKLAEYKYALADYNQAIARDGLNAGDYANRGSVEESLAQPVAAKADYLKAISMAPDYAPPYDGLASIYLGERNFIAAINADDRAIGLSPAFENAFVNRGLAHSALREYHQALADFERALELDPQDSDAVRGRDDARTRSRAATGGRSPQSRPGG
jgi:tetratricopeptide (TPR) repeat protein